MLLGLVVRQVYWLVSSVTGNCTGTYITSQT
jgi:hypothetical protein